MLWSDHHTAVLLLISLDSNTLIPGKMPSGLKVKCKEVAEESTL
jgi:hypothetical protein